MKSFENQSIYVRDAIRGALILFAMGIGWQALKGEVVALDDRQTATDVRQTKQDKVVEQIRADVAKLSTGQAVLSERMDTVIRQTEKTDEKLDRILERLSDR